MKTERTIPQGFMQDARGALWPTETIKEIDRARDDLVREIVAKARDHSAALGKFKAEVFGDIAAFVDLSAEKYGAQMGGIKGNITLMSFDGRYKIQRAIADNLVFDERLQVAKTLIDQCIHTWGAGARVEIMALVNDAFNVDKEGKINTGRILSLRRLNITDPQWQQAMTAIGESLQVTGTRSYVRVYERVGDTDRYRQISLDIAGV